MDNYFPVWRTNETSSTLSYMRQFAISIIAANDYSKLLFEYLNLSNLTIVIIFLKTNTFFHFYWHLTWIWIIISNILILIMCNRYIYITIYYVGIVTAVIILSNISPLAIVTFSFRCTHNIVLEPVNIDILYVSFLTFLYFMSIRLQGNIWRYNIFNVRAIPASINTTLS